MMTGGSRSTTALLVASCLLASPAMAGPRDRDRDAGGDDDREPKARDPKAVSDKDKQIASDLVKKAIARSQAGDHSAAIDIYLQAYTIVPNSILLSNIGSEFQQQGKQKEALRYFCMYLAKDPNGTNVPYALTQARQLQSMLGNNNIDDDDLCKPIKRRPPSEEGGDNPPRRGPKTDRGGGTDDPQASHAQIDTTMRYAGIGIGAAGVVGLIVGIYGGVEAKKVSDEISNHPKGEPWPNGIQAEEKRGQNYEYLQIAGLVGGGVLVGVGLYLFLHSSTTVEGTDKPAKTDKDKDKDERTVHLTPTTNGVAIFGRF